MNSHTTKKRRVNEEGGRLLSSAGEDKLMQTLNQLLDSNRTQMAIMSSMQGEIKRLTEKCDRMEKSNMVMKESQNNIQVTQTTMSENMDSRFDDVDNKQQYHEVLLKNQQWKYSAPRPSPGYWDGVEEDEDGDEEVAEEFLKRIKLKTEEMRYGTGDGNIHIGAGISYDEEFLSHWKEFANALEQYQYRIKCLPNDSDTELVLCDMDLPGTVIELLSKALESTHFNRFYFGNNNFGQAGIDLALKYLKSNCILKDFSLYDNPIEHMTNVKQLCRIVEGHPSIEKLDLEGCRGDEVDGYEMLQMIMSAGKYKLKAIDLSGNSISTGGDTFISDFLADNFVLNDLHLSGNELDDNDAIAIADVLKHNTNLRTLDLRYNSVSKAGWTALRKVEFDDTSLNSAADSNHTCYIRYPYIPGLDISAINGNSNHHFDPVHVRQMKVYSVLSSRNRECSNIGHFDDVPVESLPDMLITFQQYSEYHTESSEISQYTDDVNPLSLVYEVCRYWEKSLAVYELLSL